MDLHGKIINVHFDEDKMWESFNAVSKGSEGIDARIAYKLGHRDARHAAAGLAAKQREYDDHEFCKDIKCKYSDFSGCQLRVNPCVKTAKEFHKWLKAKG
jgi:hypothetical protein